MSPRAAHGVLLAIWLGVMACIGVLLAMGFARAESGSGWWQTDAVRRCCSEADAVYADTWEILPDGSVRATVTGNGPRNHAWAPLGRVYEVPADRIIREPGNPTGRPMLFLSPSSLNLWCFAMGAGI